MAAGGPGAENTMKSVLFLALGEDEQLGRFTAREAGHHRLRSRREVR